MRNYRNLEIWKNGIQIVKHTYALAQKLPTTEKFGLKSQITRAVVSIPSNIAEGCSRNSDVEFKRFLEIAMGSLFEVETQVTICEELKYLSQEETKEIKILLIQEAKMINSLITKIKKANS
ncbi:four helix bundle protein [Dokdonia sinensis]|uniref:Four helix bundle protein n=1 Tax=Dokdonia sinensis TaxID=2479847 RepID=A0A3M0G034_9FLAO|nr:four helix bundle protein [Dokdonia sinensis]RMB57998.1 four helix bundle protein [Dokdonia sinensis]